MRRDVCGMLRMGALLLAGLLGASCGGGDDGNKTETDTVPTQDQVAADTADVAGDLGTDQTVPDACEGNTEFNVGMGIGDITGGAADNGMMGYSVPAQKTAGLHMRQWARAVIIESPCNGKRVVLVVMETLGIFQDIQVDIIRKLKEKYGDLYTEQNVVVMATHTHSAPGGASRGDIFQGPPVNGFYQEVLDGLVSGALVAIDQAHDSLQPGSVKLAIGTLSGASVNRSPGSFDMDPEADRAPFPHRVDETKTLLRIDSASGAPIGMVDWFGVHPTSVGAINRLITSDNKGLAAWWFQKEMARRNPEAAPFIAAFANTNAGDSSPNVDGFSFEWKDGFNDYQDMWKSAQKQYDSAMALYEQGGDAVVGPIDFRMRYVKFDEFNIDPKYTDGKEHTTCPPASGYSMLAGGSNDWPVLEQARWVTCEDQNYAGCTECQGEKPQLTMLDGTDPVPLPLVLPFQVIRVGQLAFATLPFEITTVAGYRLREAVKKVLAAEGVTHTITLGYSNSYNDYMTTREEYSIQDYEGGFTVFGPWSNAAAVQIVTELAQAMVSGAEVDRGPDPIDLTEKVTPAAHWNDYDEVPDGVNYGDLVTDMQPVITAGSTASATFWAAHLANDFFQGKSFFTIEQKAGNEWVVVATDAYPETKLYWDRVSCHSGKHCSQSKVEWAIPEDATPGTYRIGYKGVWKKADGTLTPFEGYSSEFEVGAAD